MDKQKDPKSDSEIEEDYGDDFEQDVEETPKKIIQISKQDEVPKLPQQKESSDSNELKKQDYLKNEDKLQKQIQLSENPLKTLDLDKGLNTDNSKEKQALQTYSSKKQNGLSMESELSKKSKLEVIFVTINGIIKKYRLQIYQKLFQKEDNMFSNNEINRIKDEIPEKRQKRKNINKGHVSLKDFNEIILQYDLSINEYLKTPIWKDFLVAMDSFKVDYQIVNYIRILNHLYRFRPQISFQNQRFTKIIPYKNISNQQEASQFIKQIIPIILKKQIEINMKLAEKRQRTIINLHYLLFKQYQI